MNSPALQTAQLLQPLRGVFQSADLAYKMFPKQLPNKHQHWVSQMNTPLDTEISIEYRFISGLLPVGDLQQRLLIICRLLLLLLLRSLLRRSRHGVGHRRHTGVVIGRHVHGHARLGGVRSSGTLVHVLSIHTTAVKKTEVTLSTNNKKDFLSYE